MNIQGDSAFELVDTWFSENLGEVKVFYNTLKNQYVLEKEFKLGSKFSASAQEIFILEARIKELPEEVTLAARRYDRYDANEPLFEAADAGHRVYMDYSAANMRKHLLALRAKGLRVPDGDVLGFYGFLMGLGSFMEQGLEFHRSICLKNLLIVDGQLKLTNPYVSDSHVAVVLEDFVRPIIALGETWSPNLFLDDQMRLEASRTNPGVRQINELHRAYVRQMHCDSCLVFLALATMKDDNDYVDSQGQKRFDLVRADIKALSGRFDPELIAIVEAVLLQEGEKVPTFIEVNEKISLQLRDKLVQAAAISRSVDPLLDEGYLIAPLSNPVPFDQGSFQPAATLTQ